MFTVSARPTHLLASALLIAGLAACDGAVSAGSQTDSGTPAAVNFDGGGPPFLDLMVDAHFVQAYRGVQRVELLEANPPVEYLEEVGSNGDGLFAVDPLEVLSAHPNKPLYLLLAELQSGMSFRYRDFRIGDVDLLQQNYVLVDQSESPVVAGIVCARLRAERVTGSNGHHYLVDVDPTTGLVMRWQEFDASSTLLARVAFESFRYDVDVSDMDLRDKLFVSQAFSPTSDLGAAMGFEVLQPALPPSGYVLDSAELVGTPQGSWAKLRYTDGLRSVFLLHREQTSSPLQYGASAGVVRTGQLGGWSIVTGNVQGWEVILAGKVPEDDLLDMLQSAL